MAEKEGFFRTWRGDRLRWLIHHKPDALRLLLLIQDRARYSDGWNPLNLEKRQSVLGFSDVEVWGWTIRRYRTAKSDLVTAGAIDIVPTGKGTIVTLLDNVAYVSEPPKNDGQNDIPSDIPSDIVATDPRHSGDIVATDPRHLTKKDNKLRREEGKKCVGGSHTHSGVYPDSELGGLAIQAVEARDDWMLRADAAGMEIRKCPKIYREEAVSQFAGDAASMVDPWPNPLGMLRKYMSNADFYVGEIGKNKKSGGGWSGAADGEQNTSEVDAEAYNAANEKYWKEKGLIK